MKYRPISARDVDASTGSPLTSRGRCGHGEGVWVLVESALGMWGGD